jgi:hypothetical protein
MVVVVMLWQIMAKDKRTNRWLVVVVSGITSKQE